MGSHSCDAINNIRAALDHLVWTITPVKVRREFRNKIEFPIYTCRKAFVKHAAPKLEGLSPKHRALIENVQPYHGADPHIEPLEVLRRLSNTDKHRLLVSMATARNLEWVAEAGAKIAFTELSTVPLKDGAPVMRFTASPTTADLAMQVQAHAEFAIVIQDATRSQFPDAIAALHGLHWYARDWIIRHPLELGFDSKPLPFRTFQIHRLTAGSACHACSWCPSFYKEGILPTSPDGDQRAPTAVD